MKATKKGTKWFLMGMLALIAAFGLVVAGCGDGNGGGDNGGTTDTTAPVLTAERVIKLTTEAGTTATLKFTSNEAGTYYYVVLVSDADAPDAATVKAQGTAVTKGTAAATASENTISVTGLTASSTYKAYIVVEDAAGNLSTVLTIEGVNPIEGTPDPAPTLSAGSVSGLSTEAGTTATLKFTSDKAGTYYYVVLASTATAPNAETVKAQGTAVAKGTAAATAGENTISVTGLTKNATYKAYIVVENADGNTSDVLIIDGVNPVGGTTDTTAPILSAESVSDLTTEAGTTATLKFTSNEAGTYYYVVLASDAAAPNAATVKAQGDAVAKGTAAATASENTINVTGLTAALSYKAYIVVEDEAGNLSTMLTITGVNPVGDTTVDYQAMVSFAGATVTGGDTSRGAFPRGRSVTISAFKIAKYETTYQLWKEVYDWAIGNGYTFANPGVEGHGTDGTGTVGTAETRATRPVTTINWRDAIVWCNAYSEKSGKTPVYYTDDTYTTVLKVATDASGVSTVADGAKMKPGANGYRLPTEVEWEYAARGGNQTDATNWNYTYAGSDTIDDVAWYESNATNTIGSVRDADWGVHPVRDRKAANSKGLYDMSGNVFEWCWDWYLDRTSASTPAEGPASGTYRVIRGGSFNSAVNSCTVIYRNHEVSPHSGQLTVGFRVACGE